MAARDGRWALVACVGADTPHVPIQVRSTVQYLVSHRDAVEDNTTYDNTVYRGARDEDHDMAEDEESKSHGDADGSRDKEARMEGSQKEGPQEPQAKKQRGVYNATLEDTENFYRVAARKQVTRIRNTN